MVWDITESVRGIQSREGPGQTPSEPGGEARAGGRAADSQELGRCGGSRGFWRGTTCERAQSQEESTRLSNLSEFWVRWGVRVHAGSWMGNHQAYPERCCQGRVPLPGYICLPAVYVALFRIPFPISALSSPPHLPSLHLICLPSSTFFPLLQQCFHQS